MIKLAVDAMGMDKGSKVAVEGILDFLNTYKDVELTVCGKKEELILNLNTDYKTLKQI